MIHKTPRTKYLKEIAAFFSQTEKAIESIGSIQFPDLKALQNIIEDVAKKDPNSQDELMAYIHKRMNILAPYFIPIEKFFSSALDVSSALKTIVDEETELNRKYMNRQDDITRREVKDGAKLTGQKIKRLEEQRKKQRKSFNDFMLPSLKELDRWEKLPLIPYEYLINKKFDSINYNEIRTKLYAEVIKENPQRQEDCAVPYYKYQKFWQQLCEYTKFKPDLDVFSCPPTKMFPYISIEYIWLYNDYKLLRKLYNALVEKDWLEPGKEGAFVSIFSGYRFDYEKDLPIKWYYKSKQMGDEYMKSTLPVLYFLIVALKGLDDFVNDSERIVNDSEHIVKELLTAGEKNLIVSIFCYPDGTPIDLKLFRYTESKKARQEIAQFLKAILVKS